MSNDDDHLPAYRQRAPFGINWDVCLTATCACWAVEPDVATIVAIMGHTLARPTSDIFVTKRSNFPYSRDTSTHRCYDISARGRSYVLRVALRVDPQIISSEVATIRCLTQETDIPLPKIIAFDSSTENDLRFPWILFETGQGEPLSKVWHGLGMSAKQNLVIQLASLHAQLFRLRFPAIGSLVPARDQPLRELRSTHTAGAGYRIGHIPLVVILWCAWTTVAFLISTINLLLGAERTPSKTYDVARMTHWDHLMSMTTPSAPTHGPYPNSHEWLRSRLVQAISKIEEDLRVYLLDPEDDYDHGIERRQVSAMLLLHYLDRVFPAHQTEESTMYLHWLGEEDISVDKQGRITGILDWSFASVVPLWKAADYPGVLSGPIRHKAPDRERYGLTEAEWQAPLEDDGWYGPRSQYLRYTDTYEKTKLRPLYVAEMDRQAPGWAELYSSTKKFLRLFEDQVKDLENGMYLTSYLEIWLEACTGTGDIERGVSWPSTREDQHDMNADSDDEDYASDNSDTEDSDSGAGTDEED